MFEKDPARIKSSGPNQLKHNISLFLFIWQATQDATILANQLQLYYATDNADRTQLLNAFNNDPGNFKHMDIVSQFENPHMESPSTKSVNSEVFKFL